MAGKTEATVTTLTATVKTLMIGSRQVTLGIWNQLDRVSDGDIITFGRVSPPSNPEAVLWVVGKHKENETLVRSSLPLSFTGRREWIDRWSHNKAGSPSYRTYDQTAMKEYLDAIQVFRPEAEKKLDKKTAEWQALDLIVLAGLGLR